MITRFQFKSSENYQKACDALDSAIKGIGTSHFDHGRTPADKEIRTMNPENAKVIEGLFKQKGIKGYERVEDETTWIGPEKKSSIMTLLRKIADSITVKKSDILHLRPAMAKAAQKVYDEWDQSGEDGDPELGFGGLCQDVAEAIATVLNDHNIESGTVSQSVGEQHVYAIAKVQEGVFEVDISPYRYERGGGYTWKKVPGVKFTPEDISVSMMYDDPEKFEDCLEDQ